MDEWFIMFMLVNTVVMFMVDEHDYGCNVSDKCGGGDGLVIIIMTTMLEIYVDDHLVNYFIRNIIIINRMCLHSMNT